MMATYVGSFRVPAQGTSDDELQVPPPEMVAEHVRNWRRLRNWKKRTLADFARVSLSTVERIERAEKISEENLDRVAVALGFQKGAFTVPRRLLSIQEAAEKVAGWFEGLMEVPCKPLRTQPEAAALLDCAFMTVCEGEFDEQTSLQVACLREWLEFWSFLLSDLADPARGPGKREIYADLLSTVRDIESRGYTALHAVYKAQSPLGLAPVGMIAFFPKLTDPGAVKRRSLLVPTEVCAGDDDFVPGDVGRIDGETHS
jgi:transcriptional regulator with XRE-family HTH domain